jgi:peptidoglycan/LPS O-acetylase OafA/YrhL
VGGFLHIQGLGFVDGVYWTLWIEVRFYVMAALLFFLCRPRFLESLTGVMLVSFIAGLRGFDYPGRAYAWDLLLPTFLPYFAFGVAIRRMRRETRPGPAALTCAALCAVVILVQGWVSFEHPAGSALGFAVVNAAIIVGFLLFARGVPVFRPFSWGPMVRLGEASYSLYLIHSVVGIVLINRMSVVLPWPAALVLTVLLMVALSLALFRWVETPGKEALLTLLGARPGSAPAVARASGPRRLGRPYVSPQSKG